MFDEPTLKDIETARDIMHRKFGTLTSRELHLMAIYANYMCGSRSGTALQEMHDWATDKFVPDWTNGYQAKWQMHYNAIENEWDVFVDSRRQHSDWPVFGSLGDFLAFRSEFGDKMHYLLKRTL